MTATFFAYFCPSGKGQDSDSYAFYASTSATLMDVLIKIGSALLEKWRPKLNKENEK